MRDINLNAASYAMINKHFKGRTTAELIKIIYKDLPAAEEAYLEGVMAGLSEQPGPTTEKIVKFINIIPEKHYETFVSHFTLLYKQQQQEKDVFVAQLLEFHGSAHKKELMELGYEHGYEIYSREEMNKVVSNLLLKNINCQITWQQPDKKATIFIDKHNFKQR